MVKEPNREIEDILEGLGERKDVRKERVVPNTGQPFNPNDWNFPEAQRPRRLWQELLHKKCPNCSTRLEDTGRYFKCPNPSVDSMRSSPNCFFIAKTKAVEFLLNPTHPANICLSSHERATLEEAIKAWQEN